MMRGGFCNRIFKATCRCDRLNCLFMRCKRAFEELKKCLGCHD
ncbi:MAG: hypothetical protein ACI4EU_08640 [Butyrivibrio sp.]